MRRLPQFVVMVFALALIMGQPLAMAAKTAKVAVDDSTITTEVKAKLAEDPKLGALTGIEVNTTKGVVTLAGKVNNKAEKKAAAKVAKGIKGVKSVKNELQVAK